MDTLIWKRSLGKVYLPIRSFRRKIILLYHAVGNGPQALSIDKFTRQLAWLKQHCSVLSLSDLINAKSRPDKIQVAISFDDGYACLYQNVAPILRRYNFPAIVYLNTGRIANKENHRYCSEPGLGHYVGEQFLTWDEVKHLVSCDWEIGSHGVDHLDLTKQDINQVHYQLSNSKSTLEQQLIKPCIHFAYTWGKHTKTLRALVEKNNYHYAVAAHHKELTGNDNPFAIPRINIEKDYSMNDFINIVNGKWDYLRLIHLMRQRKLENSQ